MSNIWIYLIDNLSGEDDGFIEENMRSLPKFRQEQCARYRCDSDKRACIVSYQLLLKGLQEQYGLGASGDFTYGSQGKPYLKDYPHIFFNLSHCRNGVVCAVADTAVGIDIQDIRPFSMEVARRVCSEREISELSISEEPARLFCRIWTEKESYAKAEGIGVAAVFRQDIPRRWTAHREAVDYCMTLCCKEIQDEVKCQIIGK